jgi:hypothetical protein
MAQDNIPIILKEQYSDGQLLGVDDFVRERDFHIQNRELLTRLSYTPGVLTGLAVQTGPGQAQVQVDAGVAIDTQGRQIILADSAKLNNAPIGKQSGKFVIDLNAPQYYSVGALKSWLLLVAFHEEAVGQDPQESSQMKQVPLFTLVDSATISTGHNSAAIVPLALVNVTASETTVSSKDPSGKPVNTKVITVDVQVDSSARLNTSLASQLVPNLSAGQITGPLNPDQIPKLGSDKLDWSTVKASQLPTLSADKIDWSTVKADQLPNFSADKITDKLKPDQIPTLSSDRIDWSTVKANQLPNLDAANITGQLKANQIPVLDSDKIDWSTVKPDQLPNLSAGQITGQLKPDQIPKLGSDKIDWATVQADQLPNLDAGKIQSGLLSPDRLPPIPAAKITGLSAITLQTLWAEDVAIFAQGLKLVARPKAGSGDGFIIGLLKTITLHRAQTYYALGIGFQGKLLSFTSPRITSSTLKMNIYPERTLYNLAGDVGANPVDAASVQFVGVEKDYAFNLLTPDDSLPAASQGKLRSLITIGTTAIDASSDDPRGVIEIINNLRSSISPFSFIALANATSVAQATPEAMAQQLHAEGLIAPEAAPILVAQQPDAFINNPPRLIQLLTDQFKESTRTAAQMAWALSAAGIPPTKAVPALAGLYQMRDLTAGVFPSPAVQRLIIRLQEQGRSALEAAAQLRQEDAQYDQNPLALGILLRLNFSDSANAPPAVAQALKSAAYTSKSAVQSALEQLFPTASAQEIASAVNQAYPA